jgi:hypothetical protein
LVIPATPVPGTSQTVPMPKPPVAPTAAPPPQRVAADPGLTSLFDEEEIGVAGQSAPVAGQSKLCPHCRKLAPAQAVVCVECGWSFEENRLLQTKRAPKKRQADNPYGYDEYYEYDEDMLSGGRRSGKDRESANRRGPAWENDDGLITKYFQTALEILITPNVAFSTLRLNGGYGAPIMFVLAGYVIGYVLLTLLLLAMVSLVGNLPGFAGRFQPGDHAAFGASLLCSLVVGASCFFVVGAIVLPLPLLISAAIYHAFLMILGGAKQTYEATFRAEVYAMGGTIIPCFLISLIPFVGSYVSYFIQVVYTVIALKYTHEIPWWKSIVATLLSVVVHIGIFIGFSVLFYLALKEAFPDHEFFRP